MKKIVLRIKSILSALVILFSCIYSGSIMSFFSDELYLDGEITTGSIIISVQNIKMQGKDIERYKADSDNLGVIRVNTANQFSFEVINHGMSKADYVLGMSLAWDFEMGEMGKLFLFPDTIEEETILKNAEEGIFEGALMGFDTSDEHDINLSSGGQKGFSVYLDGGEIESETSIEYKFKLFFFGDQEVNENPALFHGQEIEAVLDIRAQVHGKQSIWTDGGEEFFRVTSVVDTVYPVIEEVEGEKVFCLSQMNIDLAAYATASDTVDGDITYKITISASPSLTWDRAGEYTVTYNVVNSAGNPAVPLVIKFLVWDFVKIESGYYHTLALTSHGKVYSWGYNLVGQLGDGTNREKSTPQLVEELYNIVDIAAGRDCSFAIDSSGQAYSWGGNDNGRLGDGTTTARNTPVKVNQPEGVYFTKIAARFATAGAVTSEGEVYTWGYGGYGAAGTGTMGDNYSPVRIGLSDIVELAFGYYNGAAVTSDGRLFTWGDNLHGQLGNGQTMAVGTNPPKIVPFFEGAKVSKVSVGYYHMAAALENGDLYTWGYGYQGRLGNDSTADKNTPQKIEIGEKAADVAAGYYHTGVLTQGGRVYFFGQNAFGKQGRPDEGNNFVPVLLGMENVRHISLALDSSFVLTWTADVFGMGYGGTGVLGTGNNSNSSTPVKWNFVPPSSK